MKSAVKSAALEGEFNKKGLILLIAEPPLSRAERTSRQIRAI